jgi:hypothetical protein
MKEDRERFSELQREYAKETTNPELAMLRLNQEWPDFYDRLPMYQKYPYEYINIGDLTKAIELYFISAIENFKKQNNREPSLREFIKYFNKELIKMEDEGYCYVIAGFHNEDSRLKRGFKKFITDKREAQKKKAFTRKRLDELKLYLEVYRFRKQGLKWKDIIERCGRGGNGDSTMQTLRVELRKDYNKAEKIIENVKRGIFPGIY